MPGETKAQLSNAVKAAAEFQPGYSPGKPHVQANGNEYTPPGRLGNPTLELQDEPRVHTGLLGAVTPLGMGKHASPTTLAKLKEDSSLDEIAEMVAEFEDGINMIYGGGIVPLDMMPEDAKAVKVEMKKETIKGGDGQDMLLYVYRPEGQKEKLPAVIYYHGGGMTIVPTFNP